MWCLRCYVYRSERRCWAYHGGVKKGAVIAPSNAYRIPINWLVIHWVFLKTQLISPDKVYLLAGDEVVEAKAGKRRMVSDAIGIKIRQKGQNQ